MLWHQFVYVVLSLKVVYCGCGHSPEASHYHSTPPTDDKGKLTQYQQCFYGLWIHVTTLFSGAPRASYATNGNGEAKEDFPAPTSLAQLSTEADKMPSSGGSHLYDAFKTGRVKRQTEAPSVPP